MMHSEILRRLAPFSLSPEALSEVVAIIEEIEAAPLTGAERTRRWRQRRASQNVTESHHSSLSSQNVTFVTAQPVVVEAPPIASPCDQTNWHDNCAEERKKERKKEEVVVVESDQPPRQLITTEAEELTSEIATLCGYADMSLWPPAWCGATYTVQAWLNENFDRPLVLSVVRVEVENQRKRGNTVGSINFFTKAIGRAHRRARAQQIPVPSFGGPHAETGGQREFSGHRSSRRGFAARLGNSMRRQAGVG